MITPFTDDYFMQQAIEQAKIAMELGEVPVGAVVVANQQIIGKGHNYTETLHDVTAHAEIQAITAAANYLQAKYLTGCTLYVTLEPCVMCAGALYLSQIDRIVFGAPDEKRGALKFNPSLFHPATLLVGGVQKGACASLIKKFFIDRR
ncbi:MAG: nucleoside deaminase [Flavobacteriia bacterium]|nr:nucleoside deaminase [Flavobacteriia bacterium]